MPSIRGAQKPPVPVPVPMPALTWTWSARTQSQPPTQPASHSRLATLLLPLFAALTLLACVRSVAGLDPKFDPSTSMRLVLVPTDATVGSVIYRLRATDDEFEYPLQFELVGDAASSTVQIETLPCTKFNSICQANVILTRRLEPGRYYDFQVSVKDTKGGMSVQSCSITATNFTTPHDLIFPHKAGIIMVPEDAKKGTELDYVLANKNPLQSKSVYLELWGSPLFGIRQKIVSPETTEGTIFLLGPLDFEKQAMYHLTVLANGAYAEPGQDTRNIAGLEVVIIVEDVQDVPPVFTVAPPVTRLPAGLIPGDKVLQVHAEDGDKGVPREIRYGLVSEGNPFTSFFDINETSGEIALLRPLDDILALTHAGDPVLLTVIAEEVKVTRDEPPAMATTVQLAFFLPERSNSPPYFENDHYVARLEENAAPGTVLTFNEPYTPRVMDDDAGKNGVFSLTLLDNNGTFEIAPNVAEGHANFVIRVRDPSRLDYETATYVHFQILAQELGPATNLSTLVNVTVYLTDANDNAPVFEQADYIVDLPENMTAGTRVVQVHATDADTAGLGGRVRYTQLLGPQNTSLNLDPASGVVTVAISNHGFDRESMPEYHLYVEARDDDGIGNRALVPLVIRLIDVNDESPRFERPLYEFILSADLTNFTVPAFIRAHDADAEAPNNEVRYELIYGNYGNKFFLHPITGELRVAGSLRSQQQQQQQPTQRRRRRRRQLTAVPSEVVLRSPSAGGTSSDPQQQQQQTTDVFVLTARAFDLGVPVRYSTTTIRVYPPESRTRTVTFLVPGRDPDRRRVQETLQDITGGRVIIQEVRPATASDATDLVGDTGGGGGGGDRSVVIATILYDSDSVVDIARIQQRLSINGTITNIISQEERSAILYKAENRVLFWLLIFLAILLALGILTLLLCCICPWCPLNAANRKRILRVNNIEDDVHLVHRKQGIGKQSKSVQVAEWMGRREAWSAANRSTDSRTKPTHWEYRGRRDIVKGGGGGGGGHGGHGGSGTLAAASSAAAAAAAAAVVEDDGRNNHDSNEDDSGNGGDGRNRPVAVKIRSDAKGKSAKEDGHLHRSRTNLLNADRDMYVEDVDDPHDPEYQSLKRIHHHHHHHHHGGGGQGGGGGGGQGGKPHGGAAGGGGTDEPPPIIDDDSMRRHELDRGSDLNYERRGSFKRQHHAVPATLHGDEQIEPRDQYFIKDGNAEILRLITRGRNEEENIYVNVPQRHPGAGAAATAAAGGAAGSAPTVNGGANASQYIMVDNGGKEILMRRYIEEQANGKQIIREHYQLLPGTTFIQTIPNEVPGGPAGRGYAGGGGGGVGRGEHVTEVKISAAQVPVAGRARKGARPGLDCDECDDGEDGGPEDGALKPAVSTHSLIHQELENSLKQQNALLRQILLEKEKLEEKYNAYEQALETQSLPCQSMAVMVAATQTDCDTGTQTDPVHRRRGYDHDHDHHHRHGGSLGLGGRRRTKSENDDSLSEDEYEYVRYSPPDSPDGVYLIKRHRHRKKSRSLKASLGGDGGGGDGSGDGESTGDGRPARNRHVVVVESVKRKIRTPIREEDDDDGEYEAGLGRRARGDHRQRQEQPLGSRAHYRAAAAAAGAGGGGRSTNRNGGRSHQETRTSILRRKRNEELARNGVTGSQQLQQKEQQQLQKEQKEQIRLKRDVLLEIADSLQDGVGGVGGGGDGRRKKVYKKNVKYYEDSDGSEREVVVQKNYFSADSLDEMASDVEDYRYQMTKTSKSVTVSPKAAVRRDNTTETTTTRIRLTTSDSPKKDGGLPGAGGKPTAPKPPRLSKSVSREEALNEGAGGEHSVNPKYMDWYYNLGGKEDSLEKQREKQRTTAAMQTTTTMTTSTSSTTTITAAGGGRKQKAPVATPQHPGGSTTVEGTPEAARAGSKPEPAPRTSPPKDQPLPPPPPPGAGRLLKEDIQHARKVAAGTADTGSSHPLLQHSEHRYEAAYDPSPQIPAPPDKLPHYLYPETPPIVSRDNKVQIKIVDSSAAPVVAAAAAAAAAASAAATPAKPAAPAAGRDDSTTGRQQTTGTGTTNSKATTSKTLNVSTLEDDHDSGIAMNSLLNTKGRRNKIADKKSIFTIAYDDVRIRQIRSESDTPPFS
ncbi:cadherin-86C isoform X3 [Anopheles darlingi]|nr:cadherin-86C isoform X3 [Anopheles darlingi]XP_049545292.1 cadherin-86C isoform X3 [Anopheles darlingi]XP_049545302.1 cadherin-86C isoform X3 [Anopheles darlingi]